MRKTLNLVIVFLLMLTTCLFPVSVNANEQDAVTGNEAEYILPRGGIQAPPEPIAIEGEPSAHPKARFFSRASAYTEAQLYQELEDRVKAALLSGVKSIDISDLQIDKSNPIGRLTYFSPYISNGINIACYYTLTNNQYASIEITNSMTVDQTKAYIASVDAELTEILAQVNDAMSDEQKALAIHDYLIYEYEYDYDSYTTETIPEDSYRSGGLLMNRTGVCQAYAYAFYYLMSKFDIECYVTASDTMNHAWNIVKIQDDYYHVDCTYDDPVTDRLGQVGHNYFLLSDSAMQDENHQHSGWDLTNLVCDNNQYDNAYWSGIGSRIYFDGQTAYYLRSNTESFGGSIIALNNGKESALVSDLGKWMVFGDPSRFYRGAFSGLYLKNKELYYNTATQIRKYSLVDGSDVIVATPDTSNGYIYGSRVREKGIQYLIKKSPAEQGVKHSTGSDGTFTIQYVLNGGKNAEGNPSSYSTDRATVILKNPTRSGYSFGGWYSDSGFKTKVTQITKGSSGNKTLYAKWISNGYQITYQLNGGKNSSENPSTYTSSTATITLKNPTRSGYTFGGWYSDSGYKTKVTQIVKGSSGNKTFYAKWTPTSYKITYQLNGGKNASNPSSYTIATSTITLKNPTRSGYSFGGWYSDSGYKTKVTQIAKGSSGNKTLYAKWTPISYKITYQLNGGKNASNPSSYTIATSTITLKNPTRSGYSFGGWYSDSGYKTKVTQIAKGSIGNKTLYAKWTAPKYKLTYQLNGGKNSSSNPSTYTKTTATITLKNPTRKGYTFKGWYSDKALKKKVTKITKGSTGNKTLYAKWSVNSYKVRYNKNGATKGKMSDTSCKYSSTCTLRSNAFQKKGYSFAGWATSKSGKVVYKNKAKVKGLVSSNNGVKTLYAKWKVNTYKITYKLNGGKQNKKNASSYKVTSTTFTLKSPTRKGYTFKGWYSDKACKKKVTKITKGSTGNKTLYAKWAKKR